MSDKRVDRSRTGQQSYNNPKRDRLVLTEVRMSDDFGWIGGQKDRA